MGTVEHASLALEGAWRLVAFGKTVSHTPYPGNISTDTRFLVKLRNLKSPQSQVVQVPVGELPLLYHEAVFVDGRLSLEQRFQANLRKGEEALNFAPANLRIFRRLDSENGQLIIPLGSNAALSVDDDFNGYFLGVGQGEDPFSAIIPAVEVLRFFYATSDNFTKALFDGRILNPHANLFYNEYLDEHGTGSMILRKSVKDADAIFLSRFAFSTYAMKQAKSLHLLWSLRHASGRPTFVSALPPLADEAETKFLYRQIDFPGGTRKLITRILSCNCPPACLRLLTGRETDPLKKDRHSDGSSSAGIVETPSDVPPETLADSPPKGESTNSIEDPEINSRFPALMTVHVTPQSREVIDERAPKKGARVRPGTPSKKGSVVPGRGTGGPVARTRLSGTFERKPPDAPKKFTRLDVSPNEGGHTGVINRLMWIELFTTATVTYRVALATSSKIDLVPVNVYPDNIEGKKKAWLYVDKDKTLCRFALVAEVKYQGRIRYVLELQQVPEKPLYSTIVFWNDLETLINNGDIKSLLMSCAIEGKATLIAGDCSHIQWGRLNHTPAPLGESKAETAQGYLDRIINASPVSPNGRACAPH